MSDAAERSRALDPETSFIVQAPAGSGKTELLIQRTLRLLATVQRPEEVLAMTFTKKAAAEMQKRLWDALVAAQRDARPEAEHKAVTWDLARAVLARDAELGWKLAESSARLRIQTIDSLCAYLTGQMPVMARFGAKPAPEEDAQRRRELYLEAARNTLALVESEKSAEPAAADAELLLRHLDVNAGLAEGLLADMLQKRDHWMRQLGRADDRAVLEAALVDLRRDAVRRVRALMPANIALELTAPDGDDDAESWAEIAAELLTQKGEWRKRHKIAKVFDEAGNEALRAALINVQAAPPATYTDAQWEVLGAIVRLLPRAVAELKLVFAARGKADFVEIAQGALAALETEEGPTDLLLSLDYRIRHILVDEFQDTSFTQFELLEKLTAGWQRGDGRTLFVVGDPMQSIYRFREAEVGLFLGARHEGLGGIELEPLTLSANFRSQADIVEWVNTAFEQVMPEYEDVAAGAVSYAPSEAVHPADSDAVSVHAFFDGDEAGEAEQVAAIAKAALNADDSAKVAVLVRTRRNLEAIVPALKAAGLPFRAVEIEALGHRQVVQDLLALTRALNHLADRLAWLAVLRAPWCGLTLADLYALAATDASLPSPSPQPSPARGEGADGRDSGADTISTSLSPSTDGPTFGTAGISTSLSPSTGERTGERVNRGEHDAAMDEDAVNAELRALDAEDESPGKPRQTAFFSRLTIWELMHDEARLAGLSSEGRVRIVRLREVLAARLANRLRASLRDAVESAWLALGGPACVAEAADLEDAEIYLDYLESSEQAGALPDVADFEAGLAGLYAPPDLAASERLQLMTIHKAKGLEFDTVILPGLGATGRSDERELFIWMERPAPHGGKQLLLAPVNPTGSDKDKIYETIRRLERDKAAHETGRLLYVATTRAKQHLHLLGSVKRDDEGAPKDPAKGSLLEKLWPVVASSFAEAASLSPPAATAHEAESPSIDQALHRLPANWQLPPPPAALPMPAGEATPAGDAIEFSWAGATAREVGSVAHLWLQKIAEDALQGWSSARIAALRPVFRAELAARGVGETELPAATERVATALANALSDERGRWLLGPQQDARNEYRITAMLNGERRNLVIDRTFTDADGKRWIIDYKTGGHEGADVQAFLDSEQKRYRPQLERYALVQGSGDTHLGLYFPVLGGWRAWQKDSGDEPA